MIGYSSGYSSENQDIKINRNVIAVPLSAIQTDYSTGNKYVK